MLAFERAVESERKRSVGQVELLPQRDLTHFRVELASGFESPVLTHHLRVAGTCEEPRRLGCKRAAHAPSPALKIGQPISVRQAELFGVSLAATV